MKKYKSLLIDLDNCFYDYASCNNAGMDAVYQRLFRKCKFKRDEFFMLFDASRIAIKAHKGNTASSHSRLLYFQNLTEKIYGKTDINLIIDLHETFWKAYL